MPDDGMAVTSNITPQRYVFGSVNVSLTWYHFHSLHISGACTAATGQRRSLRLRSRVVGSQSLDCDRLFPRREELGRLHVVWVHPPQDRDQHERDTPEEDEDALVRLDTAVDVSHSERHERADLPSVVHA